MSNQLTVKQLSVHPVISFACNEWHRLGSVQASTSFSQLVIGTWSDLKDHCPELLTPEIINRTTNSTYTDDYFIYEDNDSLVLSGKSERATLFAVYQYAKEAWGLHWVYPGSEPQFTTQSSEAQASSMDQLRFYSPLFERRGYVVETVYDSAYLMQLVDWLAKNRINEIFFTFMLWDAVKEELIPEITKRGLNVTLGGHSLKFFINRSESQRITADHPYTAKKQFDYNDTTMSASLIEQISDYCKLVPNLTNISLWPEDVADRNGAKFLPSYIRFSELLKERLLANGLHIELEHIVYNAGLAWNMLERGDHQPSLSVDTMFAYWGRDYRYGYPETSHENEQRARRSLEDWTEIVQSTGRKLTVFEYYSDHYMLSSLFPALPRRIVQDVEYYSQLGIHGMVNLIVPYIGPDDYPWQWVHGFNSFVFNRAIWGESMETILDDYYTCYPEQDRQAIRAIFEQIEASVTELTYWNVPLFPARAIDPDKAVATEEQMVSIVGTFQNIQNRLSPTLHSKAVKIQPSLSKYIQRLVEQSAKLEEQWRHKGGYS